MTKIYIEEKSKSRIQIRNFIPKRESMTLFIPFGEWKMGK